MASHAKPVRQTVSLSPVVARRVKTLARANKTTATRIVADLIEAGLRAKDTEKQRFLRLADELANASDPREQQRLKDELARLTFGE